MDGMGIIKGMGVTLKRFIDTYVEDIKWLGRRYYTKEGVARRMSAEARGIFTVQYPEEKLPVPEPERLASLNTIKIPDGVDDLKVRKTLLNDFRLEIGGGLGKFAGKAWRVGLMGFSSSRKNVLLFLSALYSILNAQGVKVKQGGIEAASAVYAKA